MLHYPERRDLHNGSVIPMLCKSEADTGPGPSWQTASLDAAVREVRAGLDDGDVSVGSALDLDGELAASGRNLPVQQGDPTAHGEMLCLRQAGRRASYRSAVLYTTLAPCAICTGATIQFRIRLVVVCESRGPDPRSWTRLNPAVLLEEARRSPHGQEELHRRVPSAGR
jgi:tRNA(Arg) A34 adenosine deaminase TadA